MLYNRQVIKSWPEPPPAPARPPAPLPPALKQGKASFDYVVIGAGSAGCAFVSQLLSSSANVSVLLLEAGAANDVPEIRDFTKAMNLRGTKYDWNDKSQPQTCMDGEHMPYDAGKVYGGSSSINGMVWVRGNPADYDIWASQGNKGWNWSDVEPVFKRQERWAGQSSPVRGNKGPIYVTDELSINPVSKDFVTTVVNMGFSRNPDYNAQTQYGVGFSQLNVKPSSEPAVYGIRQDSFNTLVGPWLGDERLIPLQDARVQHIDLVNGRADTVRFNFGGDPVTVGVNKEVILCAGTLRSPQVLMLSGIGDPDALRKLGIPVAAPLPGVGRNLQDQVIGFVLRALKRTDPGHFSPMCANIFANGLPGSPDVGPPDFEVQTFYMKANPGFGKDQYGIGAIVLHPAATGSVTLASNDYRDPPMIQPNLLCATQDVDTTLRGLKMVRAIADTFAAKSAWLGDETLPGKDVTTDEQLIAFLKKYAVSDFHYVGSCRMGSTSDRSAVVDNQLRVHGVERLRVVDASIMPSLVSGNTNAASNMIGGHAADFVLTGRKS